MPEVYYSNFSGGLNITPPEDLLMPSEALRAENVTFEEQGSVGSWGTRSKQNSTALTDSTGTVAEVHSLIVSKVRNLYGVGDMIYAGSLSAPSATIGTETVNTSAGPNSPRVGTSVTGANQAWSNPGNILSSDDSRAQVTLSYGIPYQSSNPLRATGFNFSIPSAATILGIKVEWEGQIDNTGGGGVALTSYMVSASIRAGTGEVFSSAFPNLSDAYQTTGGATSLWSFAWTPTLINDSTFGVELVAQGSGGAGTIVIIKVDHVRVTVYYSNNNFTLSAARRISWCEYVDKVIFEASGKPFYIKSTGNVKTIHLAAPTATPTAVAAGSGTLNATYNYEFTYADSDSHESNASPASAAVSPAGTTGVDVRTLTASTDSKVAKRFIYRKGGNLPTYYQVGSIGDNVQTSYHDSKSDADILTDGLLLLSTNNGIGSSANVRYPVVHYDRIFWVDYSRGNRIIWSKPLNPLAYPTANYVDVGTGGNVTALVPFLDELIIFKEDSIWKLSGSTEEDFVLSKTLSPVGTSLPYTVGKTNTRIVFINEQGLWQFNGVTSSFLTNRLEPWFRGLTKAGVNPIEMSTAATMLKYQAVVYGDVYYLAYAESGNTSNTKILKVDLAEGRISLITYAAGSLSINPVNNKLYMGGQDGFLYEFAYDTSGDNAGSSVTFTYQTKHFDQMPGVNKHYQAVGIDIDTDGLNITPTVLYDNGAVSETLSTISASARTRKILRLSNARARKARNISLQLSATVSRAKKSGTQTPAIRLFEFGVYYEPLGQRAKVG